MTRGFTLLELLAVMAIIAILASVSIVGFQKFQARAEEREVEAFLREISSGVIDAEYEVKNGDYPMDDYTGVGARPTNDLNVGVESLVAIIASPKASWALPDSKHLANTDNDKYPKKVTSYETLDAFEYVDKWGNPFAYFHCKSYGRPQKVLAKVRSTGVFEEQSVNAVKDPKTGQYFRPTSFQLISAGRDGVFGTADDLANFEFPTN